MTRKLQQPYLRKSDQACFIFLVTFWNYPARSKDQVSKKKKKKQKQKSDEKFSTVSCQFPAKDLINEKKMKKKKEKENSDEKFTALLSGKVSPDLFNISCHFFGTILRVVKIK